MYDPTREAREFVGTDHADAMAKAVAFFGVGEDAIASAQPRAGEIFGLGNRVVIVAYPRSAGPPRRGEAGAPEPRRSREGGRESRRDDDRRGRGPREGGRDRDRRGGRDGGRGARGGYRERESSARETRSAEPEAAAVDIGPSVGTASTPLSPVAEFVKGLVEKMEVGPFEIAESGENTDLVILQIRGGAAQHLARAGASTRSNSSPIRRRSRSPETMPNAWCSTWKAMRSSERPI